MKATPKIIFWLCVGLLVRLLYGWGFGDPLTASDAADYHTDGLRLLNGEAYTPLFPPGLPLILAGWMAIWGSSKFAVMSCMIMIYLLFFIGYYKILFYSFINLISCKKILPMALFALMPAAIHQSVVPLTHLLLATCLLWAWHWAEKKHPLLAGLAAGLAILVRPAAALAAVVIGWRKIAGLRQRISFAFSGMLFPVIWLIFTTFSIGKPAINEFSSYNFFLGNNPYTPLYKTWHLGSHEAADSSAFGSYVQQLSPDSPPHPTDFSRAAWQHIAERPDLFVVRTLSRMRTLLAFDTLSAGDWRDRYPGSRFYLVLLAADALIGLTILLLGSFGLISSLLSAEKKWGWDVVWLLLALAAPYWLAFSHPTYHLPMLPFLALFVGKGWHVVARKRPIKHKIIYALFSIMILFIQIEWIFNSINH